jgi:hypothetical protein
MKERTTNFWRTHRTRKPEKKEPPPPPLFQPPSKVVAERYKARITLAKVSIQEGDDK